MSWDIQVKFVDDLLTEDEVLVRSSGLKDALSRVNVARIVRVGLSPGRQDFFEPQDYRLALFQYVDWEGGANAPIIGQQYFATYLTGLGKFDLDLDQAGRLNVAMGRQKLSQQIARAVVNKPTFSALQAAAGDRNAMHNIVLSRMRSLKERQIEFSEMAERDLEGFDLFHIVGGDWVRLNDETLTRTFVHEGIINGFEQTYGVRRHIGGRVEFDFIEVFGITPSRVGPKDIFVSSEVVVAGSDRRVDFVFRTVPIIDVDEFLDRIDEITVASSPEEPRQTDIRIGAKTLAELPVGMDRRVVPTGVQLIEGTR